MTLTRRVGGPLLLLGLQSAAVSVEQLTELLSHRPSLRALDLFEVRSETLSPDALAALQALRPDVVFQT